MVVHVHQCQLGGAIHRTLPVLLLTYGAAELHLAGNMQTFARVITLLISNVHHLCSALNLIADLRVSLGHELVRHAKELLELIGRLTRHLHASKQADNVAAQLPDRKPSGEDTRRDVVAAI